MAPAGSLGSCRSFQCRVGATLGGRPLLRGRLGCRLADGVGQGEQVVGAWLLRCGGHGQTEYFPAPGNGQGAGVLAAQVIAVGFGVGGQGPEDRGGIRVDVGQRRYR